MYRGHGERPIQGDTENSELSVYYALPHRRWKKIACQKYEMIVTTNCSRRRGARGNYIAEKIILNKANMNKHRKKQNGMWEEREK